MTALDGHTAGEAPRRPAPDSGWRDHLLPLAALAALCLLVYSNTFHNGFHLDDHYRIVENPGITSFWPPWRHFLDPTTIASLRSLWEYRPLLPLTLSANYALFGLEPVSYHLVNLALHFFTAVFCYLLFLSLLRHWSQGFLAGVPAQPVAFFGAALFAVHPISGFPVNYLCSRDLLMMQAFLTAALYLYVRMRERGETLGRWALILALLFLSLLAKVNAALAPAIIFLFEVFLAGEGLLSRKLWRRVLTAAAAPVLFLVWTDLGVHFSLADTSMSQQESKLIYLLTQLKLHLFFYFRNFFWPFPLRDLPHVPPVDSWLDLQVLAGLVFVLLTLALGWLLRRRAPLASFCIFSYWVMVSLESSFLPIYQVARPYRIYPALPYLALLLSLLAFRFLHKKTAAALLAVFLLYFSASSFYMNRHFRDDKTFWAHIVSYGADEIATMNYGLCFWGEENETAKKYFEKSLEINPNFYLAHINLGLLNIELGQKELGLEMVRKGVSLSPPTCLERSLYWLREAYDKAGNPEAAYETATAAFMLNPENPQLLYDAAFSAQALEKYDDALLFLDRLHRLQPNLKLSRFLAGWCHQASGRPEQAVAEYKLALQYDPNYPQTYANLGYALLDLGRPREAQPYFEAFLRLEPGNQGAREALARCLQASGSPSQK